VRDETLARRDAGCERLMSVPGIGRSSPARGWQRSALEMRPQRPRLRRLAGARSEEISTGDRTILGEISKRGNRYLRVLFVQAAWVVTPYNYSICRSSLRACRTSSRMCARSAIASRV
jgi:transposase